MTARTIRVAFCGCGDIARRHARVLATLGAEVVGCWNPPGHAGSAEALAELTGARYVTDDLDRIVADESIDAVYVCTWHHDRVEVLDALATGGKAVFMEKPLALHLDELRQLSAIVRRTGIHFHSGYKTRFNSAVVAARARMPSPEAIVAHVVDEPWPAGSRGADLTIGGGHILVQGVYALEAAHLLADARPVAVTAVGSIAADRSTAGGSLACAVEFANRAVASVMISDGGAAASPVSKFFAEAAGGGEFVSVTARFTRLCHRHRSGREEVLEFVEDGFRRQSSVFLDNLRLGRPSACGVEEGMIPSLMVLAAIESARAGRRVEIADLAAR